MDDIDKRLLNDFQQDIPLTTRPFAKMAENLGVSEDEVINKLQELTDDGTVSRVGPVFAPGKIGASSLVAMAVPDGRLQDVAEMVNAYPEVNHNYEREHHYNLWFVLTAANEERLQVILDDIENRSGDRCISLPMLEAYHLDLGFELQWN